jgi:ABC-type amino acid transport substrate-binding protein
MLKEHSEKYNNLEDFLKDKNTKVAVVRGFSHGMFYDDMLKRIERDRINEVPDLERLFILLKNKRVDLVISLSSFYRYEFKKFNMEELVEIKDWDKEEIGVVYGGLVLSKQYFDINEYKYIYNIFVDMKRDGTLEKIALKYLTKEEVEEASRLLDLKYFNRNNP